MANRQMNKCSTSLGVREIQIKTTVRYHLPPVRMAIIRKSTESKSGQGSGKTEPSCTVGGCVNWCSHCGKKVWRLLKTLKIEL